MEHGRITHDGNCGSYGTASLNDIAGNERTLHHARQQTFITKSLGIALALHGTHPSLSQPKRRHFVLGRKRFECFPSLFPAFTVSILIHFLNHSFLVLVHSGQC